LPILSETFILRVYIYLFESILLNTFTEIKCSEAEVKCDDGLQCVTKAHYCDGYKHCLDGSDENEENCKGLNILSFSI